jgi:hypothetical protein
LSISKHFLKFPAQDRAKIQPELMSIFGKHLPYMDMWPMLAKPKIITLSVLMQIKNGLVVLFSFAKEAFLPKG